MQLDVSDGVTHADGHAACGDEVGDLRRKMTDEVSVQNRILRRAVLLDDLQTRL